MIKNFNLPINMLYKCHHFVSFHKSMLSHVSKVRLQKIAKKISIFNHQLHTGLSKPRKKISFQVSDGVSLNKRIFLFGIDFKPAYLGYTKSWLPFAVAIFMVETLSLKFVQSLRKSITVKSPFSKWSKLKYR